MSREAAALVSAADVEEAGARIRGAVRRTPLIAAPLPQTGGRAATDDGPQVWLKCESLQRVSAFKARGAYHFVSRLPEAERAAGLLTYSSGNHAQAVAWAAREFGTAARIVMPVDAPEVKREATMALGAKVELVGTTSAERRERAEEIQRTDGGTMVPPFDHPHIIAGQGTVALEIVEQMAGGVGASDGDGPVAERSPGATADSGPWPRPEATLASVATMAVGKDGGDTSRQRRPGVVLAPIGGGGLLSGVAAFLRRRCPDCEIVGVEPAGAASMLRSLEQNEPVTLDRVSTIADGLKPARPGDLTFAHCRELVHRVVTVDDATIRAAVRWLFGLRLVVEPSGAATVAALLSGAVRPAGEGETVAILSGGNVDPALLCEWVA